MRRTNPTTFELNRKRPFKNIGICLGQDITTEIRTRMLMVIPEPTYSQKILDQHTHKVRLHNTNNTKIRQARQHILDFLEADVTDHNPYAILKTSEL